MFHILIEILSGQVSCFRWTYDGVKATSTPLHSNFIYFYLYLFMFKTLEKDMFPFMLAYTAECYLSLTASYYANQCYLGLMSSQEHAIRLYKWF